MKWVRRTAIFLALLVCVFCIAMVWTAQRTDKPVGFQLIQGLDGDRQPLTIAIWYPTLARPSLHIIGAGLMNVARDAPVAGPALPLVVISHGNAGGPTSHTDLALALASAGYIVAAPVHARDNYADHSAEGTVPWLSGRNRQMHLALDYLLTGWRDHAAIDPGRIGAFGFSAGGLTVLTSVGAQPDLRLIAAHCAHAPEFICGVYSKFKSPLMDPTLAQKGNAFTRDARIKAAVLAAPGLAFTLGPGALEHVQIPVQLWSGDRDQVVPDASNSAIVRSGLGNHVEAHTIAGAGHYAFLAPCGLLAPPMLCSDEGNFDRKAFHAQMDASVIAFFNAHLQR